MTADLLSRNSSARDLAQSAMSKVRTFDVTISAASAGEDHAVVGRRLAEIALKFVFQKEVGEGGFANYQVRLLLQTRISLYIFKRKFNERLWNGDMSITASGVHRGRRFNYVMKDEREGGPWRDDLFVLGVPSESRQLQHFMARGLSPWQIQIESLVQQVDGHEIALVHDGIGNVGEGIFAEYLEHKRLATAIPLFNEPDELMQIVHASENKKAFFIYMPRSASERDLDKLYAAIEILKDGWCCNKRRGYKQQRFDRPQVVIFSNRMPQFNLLGRGRWAIYNVLRDHSLQRLDVGEAVKLQKWIHQHERARKKREAEEDEDIDLNVDLLAAPASFPESAAPPAAAPGPAAEALPVAPPAAVAAHADGHPAVAPAAALAPAL